MIDPKLIAKAKAELEKIKREEGLSPADKELLRRYPKHTLEAARLIDSTQSACGIPGCRCAFDLIRLQEVEGYKITDEHT